MTKIYATLGRKFNKQDLEKAMQANQQLEDDPTVTKSYTSMYCPASFCVNITPPHHGSSLQCNLVT